MEENPETIVEEREDLMVSFTGHGTPILRTGYFLKPFSDKPFLPSHSLLQPTSSNPSKPPLKIRFNGWRYPTPIWKLWVDNLHSKHQSTWKEAGIYDSIMTSTYKIQRNDDLVFELAEKWCSETNTFIFPWGEATITLEDMIVLGGYSVLGDSVSSPLETDEMRSVEEDLLKVRQQISKTKAQKASLTLWSHHFMENDTDIEHEAFLSFWLSRYIFPRTSYDTVRKRVFPIAIRLARGLRIALAPAVLANIYRDLSLVKEKLVALLEIGDDEDDACLALITLLSPFHLVQIWAWERFVTLRPKPNLIKYNDVRMARWHELKKLKVGNVRLILESAGDCFQWRPYTLNVNNSGFPKFYRDREEWVMVDSDLDVEIESFARCLRVSELVGIDCIEQYLPHRVAMQFGFDQDLPGHVGGCNKSPKIAWRNYSKPIRDVKIYIPSRLFESDVTAHYSKWWKESVLGQKDSTKEGDVWQRRNSKEPEKLRESVEKGKGTNDAPPGFSRKWNDRVQAVDSFDEDEPTLAERSSSKRLQKELKVEERDSYVPDPPCDFHPKGSTKGPEKLRESVEKGKGTNDAPPGFSRKWNDRVQAVDSSDEDEPTLAERSSSKRLQKELKVEERDNHVPDPPRDFHPKRSNVFEALDPDEEDELTIGQFLNFSKNRNSVVKYGDVGKCTSDADQFKSRLPSSTAEKECVVNMELWMEGGEKITLGEAVAGGSKRDVDLEDANDENGTRCDGAANNNAVSRNNSEGKGENIGYDELEARISRLEKVFSELKVKHAHKF